MNNKTLFPAYEIAMTGFLFLCLFSGCSTSCNKSGLSAKESRMSEEFIRGQVLRYKAEIEKDLSEMAKSYFHLCAPIDSPYTPEISASIATAFAALAV